MKNLMNPPSDGDTVNSQVNKGVANGQQPNVANVQSKVAPFSPPLGLGQKRRKAHGAHRTHSNFYGTR